MAQITVKSKPFAFIPEDVKSILTGALLAGAGALLTFLAENLTSLDFGDWTPMVVAIVSVLINAARKYISTAKYAK